MGSTGYMIGCDARWNGNVKTYLDQQYTQTHGPVLYRILASATKGGVYYAAMQRTQVGSNQVDVFALVEPYKLFGKSWERELVVKDQDETMGPLAVECPEKILKLLTEPVNEYAAQWRERVREYHRAKTEKPSVKTGDTLLFDRPFSFYRGNVKVDTFRVHMWGRKKRFLAVPENGEPFYCRIDRWSLSHVPFVVVN